MFREAGSSAALVARAKFGRLLCAGQNRFLQRLLDITTVV